jgi:hypothetical protein
MVLAMLRDALRPVAKVATGGDTLVKAADDTVDLIHASLAGDGAEVQLRGWEGGSFEIHFEAKTRHETTTLNPQGLLIERLRLVDEARRDPGGDSEEEEDVLLDS